MTAVLRTLMDQVIVPLVNAHKVHGGYLEHNPASRRVFEKCGYRFDGMVPDAFTFNPNKVNGVEGKTVGLGVLTWERQSSE
jgi:RimJ/RimL family protein N-acetyltransferase